MKVNGKITNIRQLLNEDLSVNCYEIIIDVKEQPKLMLGECWINQPLYRVGQVKK